MASPPDDEVYRELASLLDSDPTRLGDVYRLTGQGMTPEQIAAELGVSTPGFVSNYRATMRALLEGVVPGGAAIAKQVASALRGFVKRHDVSDAARAHIGVLAAELSDAAVPSGDSGPEEDEPQESLRAQVQSELRRRVRELVSRVGAESEIEADDYLRVAVGPNALDELWALVARQSTSRTTRDLVAADRPELSIEQATIDWATDLPFPTEMVTAARGRLDYWRST